MRTLFIVFFFIITGCGAIAAQDTSHVHLVTNPKNRLQGFPFKFTVNDKSYTLRSGECLELKLISDSVHIIMEDKRWVKKETVDVHVAAEKDIYVHLFWGWKENDKKKLRAIAHTMSKADFDEHKRECKTW